MIGEQSRAIDSLLGWWADAGLIDAVSDQPCNWLAPVERAMPLSAVAIERPTPAPTAAYAAPAALDDGLPDDLAAFDQWLADSEALPGAAWSMRRVLPTGPANPPLMLLADVPESADIEAGTLFSGKQGQLINAMLSAIGLRREQCRIGSIALTRPLGGRIDGADAARLTAIARQHLALVQPRITLLLGQQSAQLIASEMVGAAPRQLDLNHNGVTVAAFAMHHPRLLLERPLLKRPAWEVLKRAREQF